MSKVINYINLYDTLKDHPAEFSNKKNIKLFHIFHKLYEWKNNDKKYNNSIQNRKVLSKQDDIKYKNKL